MENPTCILHISLDPSQKEQASGCQEFIVRPTCRRLTCMTPSFFLSPTGMPTRAPGRNQACPSRHPEETNIPSLQASACNSQTPHFTWNVKTNWPDGIMLSVRSGVLAGFITWNFRITHNEMNLRKRHGFSGSQNCPVREGKTVLLPWAEETNLEKTRCKITNWRESGRGDKLDMIKVCSIHMWKCQKNLKYCLKMHIHMVRRERMGHNQFIRRQSNLPLLIISAVKYTQFSTVKPHFSAS